MAVEKKTEELTLESDRTNYSAIDLDELIPEELRSIEAKYSAEEEGKPEEKKVVSSKKKVEAKTETVVEDSEEENEGTEDEEETEEELDLSSESIDKMIDGDLSAVNKKEEEDEKPFWYEDPLYKELTTRGTSFSPEKLDKLLQTAVDKKILEQGQHVQTLETESEKTKNHNKLLVQEVERLRTIERSAFFDNAPDTIATYHKPLNETAGQIKTILDLEGTDIPVKAILNAKNKAEFTELVKNIDFDDETLRNLTNYWRGYRETYSKYLKDKGDAQSNLSKHLKTEISPEVAKATFESSLLEVIKHPEFGYLKAAIEDNIENHPIASGVLGLAQQNFRKLVQAISNPLDHAKNGEFLSGIAKFTLDAANNANLKDQHTTLKQEYTKIREDLKKVVGAYRKLAASAKGISGKKKTSGFLNGHSKKSEDSDLELEQFKDLLNDKVNIDDIL